MRNLQTYWQRGECALWAAGSASGIATTVTHMIGHGPGSSCIYCGASGQSDAHPTAADRKLRAISPARLGDDVDAARQREVRYKSGVHGCRHTAQIHVAGGLHIGPTFFGDQNPIGRLLQLVSDGRHESNVHLPSSRYTEHTKQAQTPKDIGPNLKLTSMAPPGNPPPMSSTRMGGSPAAAAAENTSAAAAMPA